jgi:Rieske Fe-S protein
MARRTATNAPGGAVAPAAPTMPDAGEKQATAGAPGPSRRGVLAWLWWGLGAAALGELAWVAASFLRPRRGAGARAGAGLTVAGPASSFAPGSVTAFPQGRFYLVRLEDGSFLALHRECTHLGCTVPWDARQRRFACPCHASAFAITGEVLSPPAPRPLDLLPVRIENGIVKVDAGRRIRRAAFDPAQAVRS